MSIPTYNKVLQASVAHVERVKKDLADGIGRTVRIQTGKGKFFVGTLTSGRIVGAHIEITVTAASGVAQEFRVDRIPREHNA
jgi:hypothetical protein